MWDAGSIIGHLGLEIGGFSKGMIDAENLMHVFPQQLLEFMENPLLGFADLAKESLKGMWEAIEGTAHRYHEMGEAAENLGTSVEFISTLGAVAREHSIGVDQLSMSLKFLQQRAADALSGEAGAAKGFTDIGVSVKELQGLLNGGAEQMFYRVAQGISSIENPALRVQAANDLMSRSGFKMLGLFEEGPQKIRAMQEEMMKLGGGVTGEQAEIGKQWEHTFNLLQTGWEGVKAEFAKGFFESVNADPHVIQDTMESAREAARSLAQILPPVLHEIESVLDDLRPFLEADTGTRIDYFGRSLLDTATLGHTDFHDEVFKDAYRPVRTTDAVHIHNEVTQQFNEGSGFHAASQAAASAHSAVLKMTELGYKQARDGQTQKVARAVGAKPPTHYYPGIGH